MRKPIVILGGMGPQASLRFHSLLLEKSMQFHKGENDAYPHIVHLSLPVADFISDDAARGAAVRTLRQYAPAIAQLQPQQIVLACNTAHVLAEQVPLLREPPFLSLIATVAQHVATAGLQTVGLLATPTTIRTGLYQQALAAHGIGVIVPGAADIRTLEAAIRAVIAGAPLAAHRAELLRIAGSMQERGAQALVLGCTELPLAFPHAQSPLPALDCLDIYAHAVIARYCLYNGV